MNERIIGISGAPAGAYVVVIWPDNRAFVLPVVGFALIEIALGRMDVVPLITDSTEHPLDAPGGPELISIYQDAEWKVFAPGENGLRWADRGQEVTGRKIVLWDVSNWWPSQSPLFATADETLWTDDFISPSPESQATPG